MLCYSSIDGSGATVTAVGHLDCGLGSDGGSIVNGYWSNQVIATELNGNELIPLYQDLYSQNAPDFISENAEIIKAIDMVGTHLKGKGI